MDSEPPIIPHPQFGKFLHSELTPLMEVGIYWLGCTYIENTAEALETWYPFVTRMIKRAAVGQGWPERDDPPITALLRAYLMHRSYAHFGPRGENPTTRSALAWAGAEVTRLHDAVDAALEYDPPRIVECYRPSAQALAWRLDLGTVQPRTAFASPGAFLAALEVPQPRVVPGRKRGRQQAARPAWKRLAELVKANPRAQKGYWIPCAMFERQGYLSNARQAAAQLKVKEGEPQALGVIVRRTGRRGVWEGTVKQSP